MCKSAEQIQAEIQAEVEELKEIAAQDRLSESEVEEIVDLHQDSRAQDWTSKQVGNS